MKKLTYTLFALIWPITFYAQDVECGTENTPQEEAEIQSFVRKLQSGVFQRAGGLQSVPVKFHIINFSDGSGGIDSAVVFNELSVVNSYYANAGIEFQHCGKIDYINDDNYAEFLKYDDETICDMRDVTNVLNIYFCPLLYKVNGTDTTNLCGYAYSSGVTKNRVIMKRSCSANGSTLAHEIGHYFSLAHTHSTSSGDELVDGSNCSIAGDQLCDTPADPTLGTSVVNTSCIYTGTAVDANNDPYNPEVRNIMSYSRKSCRDLFSNGQYSRMNAYLINYRNYLVCNTMSITSSNQAIPFNFNVYPNPVERDFSISIENPQLEDLAIRITDATGRVIYQKNISENQHVINQPLSGGIYAVTLYSTTSSITQKIVKK